MHFILDPAERQKQNNCGENTRLSATRKVSEIIAQLDGRLETMNNASGERVWT